MTERMLKVGEVVAIAGISRATVYRLVKSNKFPKPKQISPARIGWLQSEISGWLSSLPGKQAADGNEATG